MADRLKNKVAIATGGSVGIGLATAIMFAEEGARVVIANPNAAAAKQPRRKEGKPNHSNSNQTTGRAVANSERRSNMFPKRVVVLAWMLALTTGVLMAGEKLGRAQGQNVPNLSGAWELIKYDGTTKGQIGSKFPKVTLEISQTAAEIKITQKTIRRGVEQVQEFTYYTDGRGETNTGQVRLWSQDSSRVESVSQWSKDKLLTRYKQQLAVPTAYPSKSRWTDVRQEWRLTSNGKTLALRTSTVQMESAPIGSQSTGELAPKADFLTSKLVFKRVS